MTVASRSDVYYDMYDVEINADPYPVYRRLREEDRVDLHRELEHLLKLVDLRRVVRLREGPGRCVLRERVLRGERARAAASLVPRVGRLRIRRRRENYLACHVRSPFRAVNVKCATGRPRTDARG